MLTMQEPNRFVSQMNNEISTSGIQFLQDYKQIFFSCLTMTKLANNSKCLSLISALFYRIRSKQVIRTNLILQNKVVSENVLTFLLYFLTLAKIFNLF